METDAKEASSKQPKTLTDYARLYFKGIIDPIAKFLNRIGLHPNAVTVLGLIGQVFAAILIANGFITWGGLVTLFMAPIDALDGTMARLRGESTTFGAFIDSVVDRYSEFFLFGGLMIYYIQQQDWLTVILLYLAAAGSQMVSYTRSRAETLGFDAKIGLFTRMERYLILIPSLIFNYPIFAIWILAIFTNITALQRVFYVHSQFRAKSNAKGDGSPKP